MKKSRLKKIRVIISILLFLFFIIAFIDIRNQLPALYFNIVTYLQFIPSLLKSLNGFYLTTIGFVIVLVLTILFGRVYCSGICPLGTLQDIINHLAKKKNRKKKFTYSKEKIWLRYSILILTILSFITGSILFINILDPYSNSGRILTQLFNPVLTLVNNIISSLLEKFDLYILYPVELKGFSIIAFSYSVLFLLLIEYMSYKRGRLFCNTICPVGTFLGLISKLTVFKLKIDKSICEGCGVCERVCKAECIEKDSKTIDFSRCISCYNCIDVCPSDSIIYHKSLVQTQEVKQDESRRNFLSRISLSFVGMTSAAIAQNKIIPKKESLISVAKKSFSSPPGSKSIEHFNSSCTACHLCISACPTKVLQPSINEYGLLNIFQPFMDYKTSYCNYDCKVCSDVCPTSAIETISEGQKKNIQVGVAKFVQDNCIVKTEKTACGACSEHCPTKAVMMVDFKGSLKIPEVTEKYCIGCGACEFACPTKPFKAIYVEGNVVHKTAELRPKERLQESFDLKEEFPF